MTAAIINGVTYVRVMRNNTQTCNGCDGNNNEKLCGELFKVAPCNGGFRWVEQHKVHKLSDAARDKAIMFGSAEADKSGLTDKILDTAGQGLFYLDTEGVTPAVRAYLENEGFVVEAFPESDKKTSYMISWGEKAVTE